MREKIRYRHSETQSDGKNLKIDTFPEDITSELMISSKFLSTHTCPYSCLA